MERIIFLVDGFNLYGSIKEIQKEKGIITKWLDLHSLFTSYLSLFGKNTKIEEIHFFTALQDYLRNRYPEKVKRHLDYIKCLKSTNINVVLGRFKEKNITYINEDCRVYLKKHEEKETDVAIGVKLFELLAFNKCDTCVLVTGDTDLIPAVKICKNSYPKKRIVFAFPYNRNRNKQLKKIASKYFTINYSQYLKYQFPDPVILKDGTNIKKPDTW